MVCAALAITAPAAAQDVAFSPPGVLIAVADTTLHLHCTGAGQPTILLEAGIAGNYLDWTLVQPLLARHRKVCAYDRAGAGFSARTDRPRDVAHMTHELRLLTQAAGISAPFVLVGHSFGGLLAGNAGHTLGLVEEHETNLPNRSVRRSRNASQPVANSFRFRNDAARISRT